MNTETELNTLGSRRSRAGDILLYVAAALCAVVVRKNVRELGLALALAAGAMILAFVLGAVGSVQSFMERLGDLAGLSPPCWSR